MLYETVSISPGTPKEILNEDLPICAKDPFQHQLQFRVETCIAILEMTGADQAFLNITATCDKGSVFTYDPESQRQRVQWNHTTPLGQRDSFLKAKLTTRSITSK